MTKYFNYPPILKKKERGKKMIKERDGVREIGKVCKAVLQLNDEDFLEMQGVIQEQLEYNHPLKMATAGWQHELGEYNKQVMETLKNLHKVLRDGEIIKKP